MMTDEANSEAKPRHTSPKKISAIIDEWDTYGSTYEPNRTHQIQPPKSQLSAILSLASIEDQEIRLGSKDSQKKNESDGQNANEFCCTSIESFSNIGLSAKKGSERKPRPEHTYFNDENEAYNYQPTDAAEFPPLNSVNDAENNHRRQFRIRGVHSGNLKAFADTSPEFAEQSYKKTVSVLRYNLDQENDSNKLNHHNESKPLHFPKEGLRPVVVSKLKPPRY